jgi:spermidine synthase
VFVAAVCIMAVEILSTRLAAPFLGSSIYTWTSAIGVVLAGISLGNYAGGRLADRFEPRRTLRILFIASSATCLAIPTLNGWVGAWKPLDAFEWPTRIFLHFLLAFGLPATVLGTMSPVVAKMALNMGLATGRTIGTLYAWGSVGSIVGTFLAGFWLVVVAGVQTSVMLIAGVLAIVAVLYGWRSWYTYAWFGLYLAAVLAFTGPWSWSNEVANAMGLRANAADDAIFLEDSQYQRVAVFMTDETRRTLVLDSLVHSKVNLADPLELEYEYEVIYAGALDRCAAPSAAVRALVIGGGGYVFPRYLELVRPGSHIEVAEIDPVVTRAAFEAFGLPESSGVCCFGVDARNHVADLLRRRRDGEDVPDFDFIFGDAFSDFSIPYHLTTREFMAMVSRLLGPDGVYMLNVIDIYRSGQLLGALVETCRAVFADVQVLLTGTALDTRTTFVIVAAHRPIDLRGVPEDVAGEHGVECALLDHDELAAIVARRGVDVLTDDHAPVENLLVPVVRDFRRAYETDPGE